MQAILKQAYTTPDFMLDAPANFAPGRAAGLSRFTKTEKRR
jgi:hypothetical protein